MSAIQDPSSTPLAADPLRLSLTEGRERQSLDGAWWPHSRDLVREVQALVRDFPPERGRITRALFSRPDWDSSPRRVDLGARVLKVGSFPRDDTHLMVVQTSGGERLSLLVVPPSFSTSQGEKALRAAGTPGNGHSAAEVLAEVGAP